MDRLSLALLLVVLGITLAVQAWFADTPSVTGTPVIAATVGKKAPVAGAGAVAGTPVATAVHAR